MEPTVGTTATATEFLQFMCLDNYGIYVFQLFVPISGLCTQTCSERGELKEKFEVIRLRLYQNLFPDLDLWSSVPRGEGSD